MEESMSDIDFSERFLESFVKSLETHQTILTRKDIEKIIGKARETRSSSIELLEKAGVPKTALLKAKSEAFGGMDWIDLSTTLVEPEMARLIPKTTAQRYDVLCVGKKNGKLVVAMNDPSDVFAVEYISMSTGCEILPLVALEKDLKNAIQQAYGAEENKAKASFEKKVGMGGKEAVEETLLQEVGKKPILMLELESHPKPSPQNVLLSITRELAGTLEIDKLLLKILEATQQLCQSEESSILLYDEKLHLLYFKCATGKNGEALKKVILPVNEESIAGWVALHREGLIINDTAKDSRHYKGIDQLLKFQTRSLICIPILVGGKLYGVLEAINKKEGNFSEEDKNLLSFLAGHAGICLANAALVDELHNYFLHSVEILITAVEALNPSFKGHIVEVARLCNAIAKELGIGGKTYETITYAALLHDIGKLHTPSLPSSDIEKMHPVLGAEMLKEIKLLKEVVPLVKMHHEWFDGSGFPEGLSGEALPIGARILSLAEDFAEWKEENGWAKPLEAFLQERGSHHDPRVLGALQRVAPLLPDRKEVYEPLG
jgi:putative nucleotidyltransferase with HDIG domain